MTAMSDAWLQGLVAAALEGRPLAPGDGLALLEAGDELTLDVVAAAGRCAATGSARRVKLNYLVNLKSGACPEDCSYCSQRLRLRGRDPQVHLAEARRGVGKRAAAAAAAGAKRVCLVASGPRPHATATSTGSGRPSRRSRSSTRTSRCAPASACSPTARPSGCSEAGADAYNHNLNTAEGRYGDICTTHTYADRVDTVQKAARGRAVALLGADRRAWARATRTWSTSSSRCATWTRTRCRSTS